MPEGQEPKPGEVVDLSHRRDQLRRAEGQNPQKSPEAGKADRESRAGELRNFFEAEALRKRADLIRQSRLRQHYETKSVPLTPEQEALIIKTTEETRRLIEKNYQPGFGVFPCSDPKENFYDQVWSRDLAHAGGNFFASADPQAMIDSLTTVLKHQREDGALPLRTERTYSMVKIVPKIGDALGKFLFDVIRGNKERPVYEGQDFSGAEDTIPAVLVAAGEFFLAGAEGQKFVAEHFDQLKKAADFFRKKVDARDNLAVIKNDNPDWADSLYRKGKLGNINIWWGRSLRLLEFMARQLGRDEEAKAFEAEFDKTKGSIMGELYNQEQGYFRAKTGEDRVDTVASIFGSLYFLDAQEAVRVEETLKQRLLHSSGLKNFDPPYPQSDIFWIHKLVGHQGYHNEFVWPWVTLQNIQVKIKIALQHPDEAVRDQYKQEAIEDLIKVSELFEKLGGAYEIVRPDEPVPAATTFYTPPKNLMGSLAAYQGAYSQLKELGWIETGLNQTP